MEPSTDLGTLLLQGAELMSQTSRAHADRWGLGTAERWSLDQREGRISWSFTDHTVVAPVQILGSWNAQVGSFVWSWDNETILESLCGKAGRVRAFGIEHDVVALTSSPLKVDEEQVRDLIALAFRVGGGNGLYHPFDGRMATYIAFGPVSIEHADGRTESFEVDLG